MENSGTASHLTTNNLNAESLFRHLVTCGICMGLYVDPVALLDCLHLACGSCAVEWLKQSSTCHQCRENVRSVRDSHHTSAIVEAYKTLAPQSSLCQERTLEELYLLREKYRPGQSVSIQGQEGDDSSLEEIESTDSDGEAPMSWSLNRNVGFTQPRFTVNLDDLALPDNQCPFCDPSNTAGYVCPEPCLERDLHAMPVGHTICGACTRLLPLRERRRDIQCCVCTRTTCREMEQVCRSINPHELRLCVLKDIVFPAHWTIPLTHAFGENDYEQEVFSTYISSIGLDLQGLFQEIVSFRGSNNLPRANWHGTGYDPYDSSVVDINDKTCQHCALDLVEASLFDWWLSKRRSADLPDEVRSRPDCWYGIECRTARHNPGHAHSYNHICRPTQGRNREDRHQDVPDNGIRAVCESDNLDDYFPAYSPSQVIFRDIGNEPVFMCSVIYRDRRGMSTIPGKTTMWNQSQVAVYFGVDGSEHEHDGVVQILIDTRNMRWVRISKGIIPPGCRPVVGGRMNVDGSSQELYHCAVWWCGQRVPGRTSRRMGHAIITWGGFEWRIEDQFELLCWN